MVLHLKVKKIDYKKRKVIAEQVDGEPPPPTPPAVYEAISGSRLVEGKMRHNLWRDGVETGTDPDGVHWSLVNEELIEWETLEAANAWAIKCMKVEDESND